VTDSNRHASADGYDVSIFGPILGDDEKVTVVVRDPDDNPTEGARLYVDNRDSQSTYQETNVHYTGEDGIARLPEPVQVDSIHIELLTAPEHPGQFDDDSDDTVTLTKSEAKDVEWWDHYSNPVRHPSSPGGYCMLHWQEFQGHSCTECLKEIDETELKTVDSLDSLANF
jgi:hypothetical protein